MPIEIVAMVLLTIVITLIITGVFYWIGYITDNVVACFAIGFFMMAGIIAANIASMILEKYVAVVG